jgi:hypothetical protein
VEEGAPKVTPVRDGGQQPMRAAWGGLSGADDDEIHDSGIGPEWHGDWGWIPLTDGAKRERERESGGQRVGRGFVGSWLTGWRFRSCGSGPLRRIDFENSNNNFQSTQNQD